MELEFIPIWFQLNRIRSENEESVLVVTDSLIRAEDVNVLVDNKGAENAGAVVDFSRVFNERIAEASVESCKSSAIKS